MGNNIIRKIFNIIKNGVRLFIIVSLLLFMIVFLVEKSIAAIIILICILLLVPQIAGLLYKKLKINRIIKYTIIIVLFFMSMIVFGLSSEEEMIEEPKNEIVTEETEKTEEKEEKITHQEEKTDNNKRDSQKQDEKKKSEKTKIQDNNSNTNIKEEKFDENNINKSITCNNKKITVKKLKRVTKNESNYVPSGKEWIGVYIIFENQGTDDIGYYESDFNLVNGNGEVIEPAFNIIKGVLDHDRLNNGTLVTGGIREGYVMFANDYINDKNLELRVVCEDKLIFDDDIRTIKLHS